MKNIFIFLLITFTFVISTSGSHFIFSQHNHISILGDIVKNTSKYNGKKVTAVLRFKNIDSTFNTITFYDKKNIDISFDISIHKAMMEYKLEMLNLHRGMKYYVTFLVSTVEDGGLVSGELIRFVPLILHTIPEG